MSRALHPEDVVSHYRIVGPLGAGGMGEVYLAHDRTLERNVALKVLPPSLVKDEERVRRFILEAKSASSLSHPNIVTIYEIGQDQVRPKGSAAETDEGAGVVHFISMELITGETLTSRIHQEKADLRTLLGYLAQAAEGLAKAHAAGIVHRDLKPGNIMVTKDGYTKVLDFGLAKLTEKREADPETSSAPTELKDRTSEGVVIGTIGYMSPEQVRGKAVDHRSDIFSFGCVLYEAATRRRPFVAESNVETMHKILNEKPVPVEEINPDVPAEVRRIIRRCLAKSPDQRLQSMKDLAIELRDIVDEYDSLSRSGGSGEEQATVRGTVKTRRSVPVAAMAAVAILGVAGIAFGIYAFLRGNATHQPAASFQSMKIRSLLSEPDVQAAVISADGRYLAYVLIRDARWSLRVRQVATGGDVEILKPQESRIRGITFSQDGNYLFYLGRDRENPSYNALIQVASLGGTPRKRGFDVDSAVSFDPDGKRICFRRGAPQVNEDHLVVLDLDSGTEKTLAKLTRPNQYGKPAWSPDGRRIAVSASDVDGGARTRILMVDPESGRQEVLGDSVAITNIPDLSWLPDGSGLVYPAAQLGVASQIRLISYPEGTSRRITNDQSTYGSVSVSQDARSLATLRRSQTANLWTASASGRGDIRQITRSSGIWQFDLAQDGSIVFVSSSGETQALFRVGADASSRQAISSGEWFAFNPQVLGSAGVVYSQLGVDVLPHIWRAGLGGEEPRRITSGAGEYVLDASPDGGTVLLARLDSPGRLWSMPAAGGEPIAIAEDSDGVAEFSPDGKLVAYGSYRKSGDLYRAATVIVPAGGGSPVATILTPPRAEGFRWGPDSRTLTFVQDASGVQNIHRLPIEGGEPAPVSHFPEGRVVGHAWSRDGSRLLVHRDTGSVGNLWTLPAGGGEPVQITDFRSGVIFGAKWTSDSKDVVFTYGDVIQDVVLITDFR